MLKPTVRYIEDAAGLEKTLRLLQALCTIGSGLAIDAAPFVIARAQLNLGRRYFRLLKWQPCWEKAFAALGDERFSPMRMLLEVMKWGFLGMYFFLEAFTITNAMGVTTYSWGPRIQLEANKCWFYALVVSMVVSIYDVFFSAAVAPTPSKTVADSVDKPAAKGKKGASEGEVPSQLEPEKSDVVGRKAAAATATTSSNGKLYTQLAIDGFDLIIPGAAIGWIPVGPVVVGFATSVSSVLAGQQIWTRVQSATVRKERS